jgi:hypothetical protein
LAYLISGWRAIGLVTVGAVKFEDVLLLRTPNSSLPLAAGTGDEYTHEQLPWNDAPQPGRDK